MSKEQESIPLSASGRVMRCKLILHSTEDASTYTGKDKEGNLVVLESCRVRFGAVWAGSSEAQMKSENGIFGDATPMAEFNATIRNPEVAARLKPGMEYYVDFIEAPPTPKE